MKNNAAVDAITQLWETLKPNFAEIIKTPIGIVIVGFLLVLLIIIIRIFIKKIIRYIKWKIKQRQKF